MDYVVLACRCLLGGVFGWSLVVKVHSGQALRDFIASTRALTAVPGLAGTLLAAAAIASELIAVVLLADPKSAGPGLAAATIVLGCYTAALALALRRGVTAPCRCLSARADPIRPASLGRNAALLAAVGIGLAGNSQPAHRLEFVPVAVSVLAALVLVALTLSFDDLAAVLSIRSPADRAASD